RASRAFAALLITLVSFTVLFQLSGFQNPTDPFEANSRPITTGSPPVTSQTATGPALRRAVRALKSVDAWTYSVGTAVNIFGGSEAQLTRWGRLYRVVL